MSPTLASRRTPRRPDSWAGEWLTRLFFHDAEVQANEALAPGLHRITLQGPQLRGLLWSPGDKLQLKLGRGMQTRTYTPMFWDSQSGRTAVLAHALADGPGSDWARHAAPGDVLSVFGPRNSLALGELPATHRLLVGDETTLGLAAAWRPAQVLLEASIPTAVHMAAQALAQPVQVVARAPADAHWADLAALARSQFTPDTWLVLAGRAATVQHLLRDFKAHGMPARRIRTRAYWADGKIGMD
jgi:NADPH-dependent ferric siderophore reductase